MTETKKKEEALSRQRYDKRLIEWKDLLPWMQDNEFVLTGYRKPSYSFQKSIQTILDIHNETANIWSHLLGALLFVYSLFHFYNDVRPRFAAAPLGDVVVVCIYYLAVINCFILSTSFHVFSHHSSEVHRFGNELDHLGVVFVIWGSAVPVTYYAFYCIPRLQYLYWTLTTAFALASAIFTLRPKFRQPAYRRTRFYMYSALGVSTFFAVVHGIAVYGLHDLDERMSLSYFTGLGLLNFTGAAIYAARIPERWYPKRFDLWGSSHQIMHVLVLLGAISQERGLLRAMERWNGDNAAANCGSRL